MTSAQTTVPAGRSGAGIAHPSLAERRAEGRDAKDRLPPSSHADWRPAADRPDPVGLLEEQNTAVKQIPARRWLGPTATPYRRDKLDDLITMQVGPARHTIALSRDTAGQDTLLAIGRPTPVLYVHPTAYRYDGDADPSRPAPAA